MNRKHSTKLFITIRQASAIIVTALAIFSSCQLGTAYQSAPSQEKETTMKKEKMAMETKEMVNVLEYYTRPGFMTGPKEYAELFDGLPTEVSALCQIVQGIMIHIFWAERYGVKLSEERKQEVQIRAVADMLTRIRELDEQPLTVARPLEKRLVGNCRDFSTMLCAMLRHQGVPARARCGFGTYFTPGRYEDHWVCEYWKANEQRWVMVDPQLDQFQRKTLKIQFDPSDMPPGQFLPAGKGWLMCREGKTDPDNFGIFDLHGMWFIRGNVVRDLLSLNKIEILPWDGWGLIEKNEKDISAGDMELLDHIAKLTIAGNEAFSEIRSIYQNDERLRMPSDWEPLKMNTGKQTKVIINGIDRYRVIEPLFECVRVVLSYRGESYSPAYIQGISGAAFRIGGICPCAPTCSYAMEPEELIRLLGYECEHVWLEGEGVDPNDRIREILGRAKKEIRTGRPVLMWHVFTNYEWDVVCGFDDEKDELYGRGSYAGLEEYAKSEQTRPLKSAGVPFEGVPLLGAIFIGEKTGEFSARNAELAALKEAVVHAHSTKNKDKICGSEWVFLEGLLCYDRWIDEFKNDSQRVRGAGDAYCLGVYRTTHRAASNFLQELVPEYPKAAQQLESAAKHFAAEADTLDKCVELLGWKSPEGPDAERNAQAAELLSQARVSYANGINEIERALKMLDANKSEEQR